MKTSKIVCFVVIVLMTTMFQIQFCSLGSVVEENQNSIKITQDVVTETIRVMKVMAEAFSGFNIGVEE